METTKQFAITDGSVIRLFNTTSVQGAVNIYIKVILRDDYEMQPDENGKIFTKENIQAAYDDWANTAIENMRNDGYDSGKYTIGIDDMIDNWSNRWWIVSRGPSDREWNSIGNQEQYELILQAVEAKGVEEREFMI